ncbi:hypothetical protein [Burkholderia ubonensis]|uniref:hypothetical protein n=1 Tax=Burkholderia ubonensis TaxID=101571 RepID=UPI000B06FAFE|nr:hypothetical protein [Burkholderia ubonensis]
MAEADSTADIGAPNSFASATQTNLRILTNRGGNRIFQHATDLREFAQATAEDLAALTRVMKESRSDSSFIEQMLGLANDLAFQLQQSVDLMCEAGAQ